MNTHGVTRRDFIASSAAAGAVALGCGWHCPSAFAQAPLPKAIDLSPDQGSPDDSRYVRPAMHYKKLEALRVECQLCPRRCQVADQERGYCGVRENRGGEYVTLVHSRVCSHHADPIEKKPLFHFLPGTTAFSIATAGCNMECKFCQNWNISQFRPEQVPSAYLPPEKLVEACRSSESKSLAFTYSEPVIFYEYMFDAAKEAKARGILPVMISNGFIEPEPMRQLAPHLSAVKVDLKAFTEKFYDEVCSGHLEPVLKTLVLLKELGTWLEIVVLIVPTLNDSAEEIKSMTAWVAEKLGPDVPVHFTRYHPTYKIKNLPPTPLDTLDRAYRIARQQGLHFVYLGNVPGHQAESTYCPGCGETLIGRYGFHILKMTIQEGKCSKCGRAIPGVWS